MPSGGQYYQAGSRLEDEPLHDDMDEEGGLLLPGLNRRVKQSWLAILCLGLGVLATLVWMGRSASPTPTAAAVAAASGPADPSGLRGGGRDTEASPVGNVAATALEPLTPINYTVEALADEVVDLPGMPPPPQGFRPFRQFAGYLPVAGTKKRVFYWFAEAAGEGVDPAQAPLTLWTNGGPGCSGLFGALAENGAFRPNPDGATLSANPWSWNLVSNMVYVEVPVGVGFSFSEDKADYDIGDRQTAMDNYHVVQAFLDRFPHLRANDFYLTSESYGGHYIPTLAQEIVLRNQAAEKSNQQHRLVNLKGFAVGNPYTDPVENLVGMFDALWGHDLLPERLYTRWMAVCQGVGAGAEGEAAAGEEGKKKTKAKKRSKQEQAEAYYSKECIQLQNEMWAEVGDVDPYALDWPVCTADKKHHHHDGNDVDDADTDPIVLLQRVGRNQRHQLAAFALRERAPSFFAGANNWNHAGDGLAFEPCEDDYVTAYLNREDVKQALHTGRDIKWKDCTNRVAYHRADQDAYMEPIYQFLMEEYGRLRVLIYSGDDDSVCATRGTEMWLDRMGWPLAAKGGRWRPWEVGGQVAGYRKKFANGLVFMTVHGAGHEVPAYKPEEALHLFRAFLENRL